MIEKIKYEGRVIALVLRCTYDIGGVNFVTSEDNPLQLASIKLNQGDSLKPHVHRELPRTINEVQEVLHVEYGKVEVGFYDGSGQRVKSTIISAGDTILLLSVGHGFNILEDSKMIEVKQGPYEGTDRDKKLL